MPVGNLEGDLLDGPVEVDKEDLEETGNRDVDLLSGPGETHQALNVSYSDGEPPIEDFVKPKDQVLDPKPKKRGRPAKKARNLQRRQDW